MIGQPTNAKSHIAWVQKLCLVFKHEGIHLNYYILGWSSTQDCVSELEYLGKGRVRAHCLHAESAAECTLCACEGWREAKSHMVCV